MTKAQEASLIEAMGRAIYLNYGNTRRQALAALRAIPPEYRNDLLQAAIGGEPAMKTISVKFPDGYRDVPSWFDGNTPRSPVDGLIPPEPKPIPGWRFERRSEWVAIPEECSNDH